MEEEEEEEEEEEVVEKEEAIKQTFRQGFVLTMCVDAWTYHERVCSRAVNNVCGCMDLP